VASGFFERLRVPEELGEGTPYGERGRIWQEGPEGVWFGKVGDELVMTGDEEAEVKAAMDRAEGKSPAGAPLREELSHSEMYGSFTKEMIGQLFSDSAMQQIGSMIEGSDMRMNVDDNVALSLDMRAKDPETAENLQKALRGAFSLMRVEASKNGEQELEWLLGQARITPQGEGKLGLDFAVPGTFLLRQMGCTPEGDSIPQ
jgi:hypothetical protein